MSFWVLQAAYSGETGIHTTASEHSTRMRTLRRPQMRRNSTAPSALTPVAAITSVNRLVHLENGL